MPVPSSQNFTDSKNRIMSLYNKKNAVWLPETCGRRPLQYYLKRNQNRNDEQTELTERENFPWHVSIFKRANRDASFAYECGGTLIPGPGKELIVLTAASCVTRSLKSSQLDPNFRQNMRVVVGPTSSNYNGNNDFVGSQKFPVLHIAHLFMILSIKKVQMG